MFLFKSITKETKRDTVKLLVGLRQAGFPVVDVNRLTETPEVIEKIKNLCLDLGNKFIKVELEKEEGGLNGFLDTKKRFHEILNTLQSSNSPFPLVLFASDLLQFFTVACEPKLEEQTTLDKLNQFLSSKKSIFGNCETNLFVLEYKVITSYNEMVKMQEDFERGTLTKENVNAQLGILLPELSSIKQTVDARVASAPDSTFARYLSFAVNYSCAKDAEIRFQANQESLSEQEKLEHMDVQKAFLGVAKDSLDKIKELKKFAAATGRAFTSGEQYSYGRAMLRKLPSDNLELITQHLAELSSW